MSSDFTRRNFFKAAGATAGVAMAAGYNPLSYAQNEKIRVALIGTGSQGRVHIEDGLARTPGIEIAAIVDCFRPNLFWGMKTVTETEGIQYDPEIKKHLYLDYRSMLETEGDSIDAVVICTPYASHYPIVMDCLDAGKYVFCEKTMAHTIEACRDIVTKCHETGLFVQCGHQRRYNQEYVHAAKGYRDGRLGRMSFIEGQWHRNGDWRRPLPEGYELTPEEKQFIPDLEKHVNWRIYRDMSAGLMSELATHHLEEINFFLGVMPTRVMGTGGIDYWRDGRDTYDNVALTYEYELGARDDGFQQISARSLHQELALINRPYTVRATWSGSLMTAHKGASVLMIGDLGAYELRERRGPGTQGCTFYSEPEVIWFHPETGEQTTDDTVIRNIVANGWSQKYSKIVEHPPVPFDDELEQEILMRSYDAAQFQAFVKHIKEGGKPLTNEMCGLCAAVCDIAGVEAMDKGEPVDIDPAWYTFDFEAPDPFTLEA